MTPASILDSEKKPRRTSKWFGQREPIEKFPAQAADRLVTILEGHGIVPGRPFRKA